MNFTKSALELTMIASIRKPQLEPNHAVLAKSHSLKSCKLFFFFGDASLFFYTYHLNNLDSSKLHNRLILSLIGNTSIDDSQKHSLN